MRSLVIPRNLVYRVWLDSLNALFLVSRDLSLESILGEEERRIDSGLIPPRRRDDEVSKVIVVGDLLDGKIPIQEFSGLCANLAKETLALHDATTEDDALGS